MRWVSLTRADGLGLEVVGAEPLKVRPLVYTAEDMEEAKHRYEMPRRDFITFNIDHKQTGVGGDDSWGARTHDKYTVHPQTYTYRYSLRPVSR